MLALVFALPAMAEEPPITHTYLTSTEGGVYVFESVITPTASTVNKRFKAIIAMYDSRGALCGLEVKDQNYYFLNSQVNVPTSIKISVTPQKAPHTIKLMLWNWNNTITPVSQFELVPTVVCDEDFGSIASVQLTNIKSRTYTFEAIFKSPINANYTPVIRMYDNTGALCGYKEFDALTLSANKRELKEFAVYSTSTPTKIYFTLRNGTDVAQFSTLATETSTEKFGMIMDADPANGVKLYATDGTYNYYDFADNFILSYGNTVVTNKDTAYNYLNTLRLKSYNRTADLDTNGDNRND